MKSQRSAWTALAVLLCSYHPAVSGDLPSGDAGSGSPARPASDWTYSFTTYAWTPWLSGDLTIKGRSFDVDVTAGQVLEALDWSGIPAWFSYAEARKGRLTLFNDIAYAKLSGSNDFAKSGPAGAVTLTGNIAAEYEQAIVEVGAAYEIWSGDHPGLGPSAFDILAGGRYWHQDATVSANVSTDLGLPGIDFDGNRFFARSGSKDWVDPFIGARLRQHLAPGQNLTVRGDVGGFDVGSDFTWQVIATYDFQLCVTDRYAIDGYLGYRALSVDYSDGSGPNRYEFDAVQQGPVLGARVRF
jgi:hypothetical protein